MRMTVIASPCSSSDRFLHRKGLLGIQFQARATTTGGFQVLEQLSNKNNSRLLYSI